MALITGHDILIYLEGRADKELQKRIRGWAKSKPKRRKKLEAYQTIFAQLSHIRNYVSPADEEWDLLKSKLWKSSDIVATKVVSDIADLDLLHYVSSKSGPLLNTKIENWSNGNEQNSQDLDRLSQIYFASEGLKQYQKTNSDAEYRSFLLSLPSKGVSGQITAENPGTNSKKNRPIVLWPFLWAAAIGAILISSWFIWNGFNCEARSVMTTSDQQESIKLSDGSLIELGKHSTLDFYDDVSNIDKRTIKLEGTGSFDVLPYEGKTFEIMADNDIIIVGEQSSFEIDKDEKFTRVLRNKKGTLEVYTASDTSQRIIMGSGDVYGFDGQKFTRIVEHKVEENVAEYSVLYIIDYLMETSNWKIVTTPYLTFSEDDKVRINLDQPYEDILKDLISRADFAYEKGSCNGCYRITHFGGK